MSKGSRLSRAIQFFREADVDEARVAFQLVKEVMDGRLAPTQPKLKFARKPRTKKSETAVPVEQASATASA